MVDTPKKRKQAAAAGIGTILPFPGGTLDAVDRAILSGVYLPGLVDGSGTASEETEGMKLIKYVSSQPLQCSGGNQNEVILWVKPELVASPYCEGGGAAFDFIDATIEVDCQSASGCEWKYAFAYDETLLLPGKLLKSSDILGVFCKGPFANWVKSVAGNEVELINNEDGTYTFRSQHGCEETFFSGDGVGGILTIEHGGTGADDADEALENLGLVLDTWEPEIASSGGMVLSDFIVHNANYMPIGAQAVFISLSFSVTISAPLAGAFYVTAPVDIEPDDALTRYPMLCLNGEGKSDVFWRADAANNILIGRAFGGTFMDGGFVGGIQGMIRRA